MSLSVDVIMLAKSSRLAIGPPRVRLHAPFACPTAFQCNFLTY